MANNIDQFNIFVAKLLESLHDSFPIPIEIRTQDFIERFDIASWLRRMDDAANAVPEDEARANPFARASASAEISTAAVQKQEGIQIRKDVFAGTMDFLIAEGFIRYSEECSGSGLYRSCRLTNKGLVHLKMEFSDKKIVDEPTSIIGWLKSQFTDTSKLGGAAALQTLGVVMTRFMSQ